MWPYHTIIVHSPSGTQALHYTVPRMVQPGNQNNIETRLLHVPQTFPVSAYNTVSQDVQRDTIHEDGIDSCFNSTCGALFVTGVVLFILPVLVLLYVCYEPRNCRRWEFALTLLVLYGVTYGVTLLVPGVTLTESIALAYVFSNFVMLCLLPYVDP